ncbi:2,3-bisphosphoglycerate-independent phosphoglycerate mutase [Nanoarchaeota archaeon NZ13-N]|nr:MAG: 2,3-bisphosphoglycerate-independent phosphoglycerate mutase [Nanoarchaeota archaeon NZ13-N]
MSSFKTLFVILDGLGDHVIKDLGNKTPLEAAKKNNIDKLARYSDCGLVNIIERGIVPGSDTGHISLFGYELNVYPGRGILEAIGSEIKLGMKIGLKEGDIAYRVNFSTVMNDIIIDRRIGRNDYGLDIILRDFEEEIEKIEKEYGVEIDLIHTVEHRGVLIMRGLESEKVSPNDLHVENEKIIRIEPLEEKAKITAEILNKLIERFYIFSDKHPINDDRRKKNLLPINYILIRGASKYKELPDEERFQKRYGIRSLFIAGGALYLGVARYLGMDAYRPVGATATVRTSLFSKAEAAISNRDKYDIIFVHIKATDSLSHDRNPKEKKKFIERIDEEFIGRIKEEFDIIVLTGDHSTSSILGRHISDPVPIFIYSPFSRWGLIKKFGERQCRKGSLGFLNGRDIIKIVLDKMGKEVMVGQ